MICPKCSNQIPDNSIFCSNCGYKFETKNNNKLNFDKKQKIVILSLLGIIFLLLLVAAISMNGGTVLRLKDDTRTVMIYLDGTTLESDGGIASAELAAIDPKTLDLNKTNILVYTGGTKKWYNYIKNTENAIYKLTSNGFEKIETYDQLDLADPETLASFLTYSYENYKAGHMDLVLFNHGGATTGAISDDLSGNSLSLVGFKQALTKSPFNKTNKLELIAFRTCLNGTIENANTFKDFSEYLVASEELTYGRSDSNVLGYFINSLPSNEDGLAVGKRFVEAYNSNIYNICYIPDQFLITYSVVDLSKVEKLTNEFEKLISSIDLKQNYTKISKIRNNLLQFAANGSNDIPYYDMIDMYGLVKQLSDASIIDGSSFEKAFNDAVVYFYTNNPDEAYGLSVYFPYKGERQYRDYLIKIYDSFDFMKDYRKFINSFNTLLNGDTPKTFSFTNSSIKTEDSKEVSLQLSDDQKDNYVGARYVLFKKDKEKPDYYELILISEDIDESTPGVIKTKIGNNLVKVIDENGSSIYMHIDRRKMGNQYVDTHQGILFNKNIGDYGKMENANITITNDNGTPKFGDVVVTGSRDQRFDGIVRDINDYTSIDIFQLKYKILDENGKLLPSDEWETTGQMTGIELSKEANENINDSNFLRYSGLDDGEFYCMFIVFDINNNAHSYDLVKVGE